MSNNFNSAYNNLNRFKERSRVRMQEELQACDNCGKQLPESKMATHFGYCRRNVKKCVKCGTMYDINFTEQHEQEYHKKEKCRHCKKQFGNNQLSKHETTCTQKPKLCHHCEQSVPIEEFAGHQRICGARTKACEKCGKSITFASYLSHLISCKGPQADVIEIPPPPRNYAQHVQNQRQRVVMPQPVIQNQRERVVMPQPVIQNQRERVVMPQPIIQNQRERVVMPQSVRPQPVMPQPSRSSKVEAPKREQKPMDRMMDRIQQKERAQVTPKPYEQNSKPHERNSKAYERNSKPSLNTGTANTIIKPQTRSSNAANLKKEEYSYPGRNNRAPQINYNQYQFEDQIPESVIKQSYKQNFPMDKPRHSQPTEFVEDQELQKAIMMSMGVTDQNNVPREFAGMDMNSSFYKDLQMQDAYYDQIAKKKKK